MTRAMRRMVALMGLICLLTAAVGGVFARAEEAPWTAIPQIDSSTARIPITGALYALLKDKYQLSGPEPICSKTHGAWLNLADGGADILFTVAPTAEEFQYFQDKGVRIEMKVFGYDGLVFIGNDENPAQNLTSDQIRGIYSGRITNWSEIADGEDAPIDVYVRNAESGSQRLFEQLVWAGYDMPDFAALGFREGEIESVAREYKLTRYDEMEGIVWGVALNKYAIGFNIMSYIYDKFVDPLTTYDSESELAVLATGDVNLRGGPGLSHQSLGTLAKGEALPYLGESADDERGVTWHKAQREDKSEAWISSRYGELGPVTKSWIKLFDVDGVAPETEHFASGDYPFVTTSIVAIRADEPEGSPARRLFDWIGTGESRALIAKNSTLSVSFSEPFEYTGGAR